MHDPSSAGPLGPDQGLERGHLEIPGFTGLEPPPGFNAPEGDRHPWAQVPWRTIVGTVAVVLGTIVLVMVVLATVRILTWIAIAGFFALVLAPLVSLVQRHVGGRRALATSIVVFATLAAVIGVLALFLLPVRTQLVAIITDLPGTVHRAAVGKGPVGNLVSRLHIESYVKANENDLANAANRVSSSTFATARAIFDVVAAFVTITLITFLFLAQSAVMARTALSLVPRRRRVAVQRAAAGAAQAVSGYTIGNLLISAIAGGAGFICLVALGVPSPVVLALWVAFADLIPLVGATIGAAVCVVAAYLQSPTRGVIALVFFVVYQQIENGLIYPWLMARKVRVNPLVVLLSVLLAAEIFGILGALLAVPVSGAVQVVVKAIRQERPRDSLLLPDDGR